jgi:hypothetical protein
MSDSEASAQQPVAAPPPDEDGIPNSGEAGMEGVSSDTPNLGDGREPLGGDQGSGGDARGGGTAGVDSEAECTALWESLDDVPPIEALVRARSMKLLRPHLLRAYGEEVTSSIVEAADFTAAKIQLLEDAMQFRSIVEVRTTALAVAATRALSDAKLKFRLAQSQEQQRPLPREGVSMLSEEVHGGGIFFWFDP